MTSVSHGRFICRSHGNKTNNKRLPAGGRRHWLARFLTVVSESVNQSVSLSSMEILQRGLHRTAGIMISSTWVAQSRIRGASCFQTGDAFKYFTVMDVEDMFQVDHVLWHASLSRLSSSIRPVGVLSRCLGNELGRGKKIFCVS